MTKVRPPRGRRGVWGDMLDDEGEVVMVQLRVFVGGKNPNLVLVLFVVEIKMITWSKITVYTVVYSTDKTNVL